MAQAGWTLQEDEQNVRTGSSGTTLLQQIAVQYSSLLNLALITLGHYITSLICSQARLQPSTHLRPAAPLSSSTGAIAPRWQWPNKMSL